MMLAVRALPRPIAVVLALLLALLIAVPLMGAKGGNTSGAKACQKGGYAELATREDPYTAFASAEACVAYAARGGSLTALVVTYGNAQFVWEDGSCGIWAVVTEVPIGASGGGVEVWAGTRTYRTYGERAWPTYINRGVPEGASMTLAVAFNLEFEAARYPLRVDPEPCGPDSALD